MTVFVVTFVLVNFLRTDKKHQYCHMRLHIFWPRKESLWISSHCILINLKLLSNFTLPFFPPISSLCGQTVSSRQTQHLCGTWQLLIHRLVLHILSPSLLANIM